MAKYDEVDERVIAKLFASALEQGISDDTDLWPKVQQRIAQRENASQAQPEPKARWWSGVADLLSGSSAQTVQGSKVGKRKPLLSFVTGVAGLGLLAVIMIATLSRLPTNQPIQSTKPTTTLSIMTVAKSGDNDLLFTIQQGNEQQLYLYRNGFAVTDDGSFWVGKEGQIEHYSPEGKLLGKKDITVTDLAAQGSNLWIASFTHIYKMTPDGTFPEQYDPLQGSRYMESYGLKVMLKTAQDGKMLLEWDHGSYLKVVGQQADPGPDGKPNPLPLPGYPANGKFYRLGSRPDEIIAGDVPLTIDLQTAVNSTEQVSLSRILKVSADGSFYVVVEATSAQWNLPSLYVLHYSPNGQLMDRARVSTPGQFYTSAHFIAPGPDGAFYAVGMSAYMPSDTPKKVDVVRLNFYSTSEPLPPVPTPIPTPVLPTPIPTGEKQAPTPVTVPQSDDFATLFSVQSIDEPNLRRYDSGIGLADDGSFWFGREDGSLAHYSASGVRLDSISAGLPAGSVSDIEVSGSDLWTLTDDRVYALKFDGTQVANYLWWKSFPGQQPYMRMDQLILRPNGDGQMLLEIEPFKYAKVRDTSNDNPWSWPPPSENYSVGGKSYRRGILPNQIVADGRTVTIEAPSNIVYWHLLAVMPDGSFYISAMTGELRPYSVNEAVYQDGRFQYVLHYSADGQLIERARASSTTFYTWAKDMVVGADGSVYALQYPVARSSPTSARVVVRLNFYPASRPLPPAPTSIPTPILLTPVPTVQGQVRVPPPVATGTK